MRMSSPIDGETPFDGTVVLEGGKITALGAERRGARRR
jgi:hypothetical protein